MRNHPRFCHPHLLVALVLVSLLAMAPTGALSAPTAAEGTYSFDLDLAGPWPEAIPTISVECGDTVTVSASAGTARACPTCWVTPDGDCPGYSVARTPAHPLALVPGLWGWALIGKIGEEGAPFNVGSSATFTATASGRLLLSVNDSQPDDYWGWADNAGSWPVTVTVTAAPAFRAGFERLAEEIPEAVGSPLENERYDAATGDATQRTTRGLMVWRKAGNRASFTDGHRTWVVGPRGAESRLNTEHFDWER